MPSFFKKVTRSMKRANHTVSSVLGPRDTFSTPAVSSTVSTQLTPFDMTTGLSWYQYMYECKNENEDDEVSCVWSDVISARSLMAVAALFEAREREIERAKAEIEERERAMRRVMDDIEECKVSVNHGMAHIMARERVIKRVFARAREREKAVGLREKIVDSELASIAARKARERDVETREKAIEIREKAVVIREK
ncbi:hypothetical protein GGI13_007387, partial [Coemansia sp. RSA 455]